MTVSFELDGQKFVALNGGPEFKFNEAISFQIACRSQAEVDAYWSRLGEGGEEGPCGWLKDRFGVSWQIVPTRLGELLGDPDPDTSGRVMHAMLQMKKLDIAKLEARRARRYDAPLGYACEYVNARTRQPSAGALSAAATTAADRRGPSRTTFGRVYCT